MRITGYDIQDFMSDPELIFRIVHPEDRPVFEQHHLEADKQMKPGEVEFRIIRKDGELRWIGHICMPVYGLNGQFLGIRSSNRDITARKKAEMAMQESGELFLKAFRNAPLLMTMSSVEDGVYIDVNEKFIEVSGFSIRAC
jgi:PAS domain S-box-containing protein